MIPRGRLIVIIIPSLTMPQSNLRLRASHGINSNVRDGETCENCRLLHLRLILKMGKINKVIDYF